MKKILSLATGILSLGLASSPLVAHHSFAMFDQTKKVTIQGAIADIQWTNPHVWIEVNVTKEDGSLELWGIELTSKVHLTRQGFPIDRLNVGDEGTFVMSPYADGRPGGRFYTLETTGGVVFRDPAAQREYERAQAEAAAQQ